MNDRLGCLIERLNGDLAEALDPSLRAKLALYVAASELLVEDEQPRDHNQLRFAVAHLVLQTLGITDASIERLKSQLASGLDPTLEASRIQ